MVSVSAQGVARDLLISNNAGKCRLRTPGLGGAGEGCRNAASGRD